MKELTYRDIDLQRLYAHIGWLKQRKEASAAEFEMNGKLLTVKTIPARNESVLEEEHSQFSQTLATDTCTAAPILSRATDLHNSVELIVEELVSNLNSALQSELRSQGLSR